MTVLIVDDHSAVRRLIAEILAPLRPSIVECDDGSDALAAYNACAPDVVLMDYAMPNLDGMTATEAITRVHPSARVIIVTHSDEPAVRDAARAAGARGYVLKDNLLELLPLIERLRVNSH
jgi:CheY-like chemotaxis protein